MKYRAVGFSKVGWSGRERLGGERSDGRVTWGQEVGFDLFDFLHKISLKAELCDTLNRTEILRISCGII